jgi:hypothetical protein
MKKLIVALAVLALCAPVALAASHYVKVSPGSAKAGATVRVYGSVGNGCEVGKKGDDAEIYSTAFKAPPGAGDLPTVLAQTDKHGNFSAHAKLKQHLKAGKYRIGGRCGGGGFGGTTLTVTN